MIDNAINDDKTIAGGKDLILAGRYCSLVRHDYSHKSI